MSPRQAPSTPARTTTPSSTPTPVALGQTAAAAAVERLEHERRARELAKANAYFRQKFGLREENLITCTRPRS